MLAAAERVADDGVPEKYLSAGGGRKTCDGGHPQRPQDANNARLLQLLFFSFCSFDALFSAPLREQAKLHQSGGGVRMQGWEDGRMYRCEDARKLGCEDGRMGGRKDARM